MSTKLLSRALVYGTLLVAGLFLSGTHVCDVGHVAQRRAANSRWQLTQPAAVVQPGCLEQWRGRVPAPGQIAGVCSRISLTPC